MAGCYKLIGMKDSPFVRRVAVTLELYQIEYEHHSLRTVGDAKEFQQYSPLMRAPTLILPKGEPLFDSHLIVPYLDELVDEERSLMPASKSERFRCRQWTGVATGIADKAVAGIYEKIFHSKETQSQFLLSRIENQLQSSVVWLEEQLEKSAVEFSGRLDHAWVAITCALRFASEVHPEWLKADGSSKLWRVVQKIEESAVFANNYLKVEPPESD